MFCRRAKQSGLLAKAASHARQLESLFDEFGRFLNLGQPLSGGEHGGNFCPTLAIDLVWHAAMMNSAFYCSLTSRFLGKDIVLPHCLLASEQQHDERYVEFQRVFLHVHGTAPKQIEHLELGTQDAFAVLRILWAARDRLAEKERLELEARRRAHAERMTLEYEERERTRKAERQAYFKRHGCYPREHVSREDARC